MLSIRPYRSIFQGGALGVLAMSHASMQRYASSISSVRPWEIFRCRRNIFLNENHGRMSAAKASSRPFWSTVAGARNAPTPWIRPSTLFSSTVIKEGGRHHVFGAGTHFFCRSLVTAKGKMDPYSVLGISRAADAKQIKLGYLQKVCHKYGFLVLYSFLESQDLFYSFNIQMYGD